MGAITAEALSRRYHKKFAFTVEEDGILFAGFQTMSDLRIQVAKIEHFEGGGLIPNKSPGRVTIPDVTLTRGATNDLDLFGWMQQVVANDSMVNEVEQKRQLAVVQRDRRGLELRRWQLVNCYPIDFKAGDWDNNTDENVVEEVILAMDYWTLGGDAQL